MPRLRIPVAITVQLQQGDSAKLPLIGRAVTEELVHLKTEWSRARAAQSSCCREKKNPPDHPRARECYSSGERKDKRHGTPRVGGAAVKRGGENVKNTVVLAGFGVVGVVTSAVVVILVSSNK